MGRATREPGHATALMGFISELQKYCNIPSSSFVSCLGIVVNQLDKYNSECTVAHRQRLVWKLSNGISNESLESLNLSSEDGAESDREMDIEEEDELDDDDDLEKKDDEGE